MGKPLKGQGCSHANRPLGNQSGQIVVEYILLMVASVGFALLISKGLIGRNPDSPGVITGAWSQVSNSIGSDIID